MLPLLLAAAVSSAAGPADLAGLKEGDLVGGFAASSVYLDPFDQPKGARFKHASGLLVDVLFFESIPQVSAYWRTPPPDDRGISHTLEHLLLGKGRAGRTLNTLVPMRLGDYTAATYSDLTLYQVSSAAGPEEFYELLETFLIALLRPDFTDEEARREVAHFAPALDEKGGLKLVEKGTVYDEMSSRTEKADSLAYYRMAKRLFGPEHPLARDQGGIPAEIWKLTPADIREYHAALYHVGPNMELAAAIPHSWSLPEFLRRLDAVLARAEPAVSSRTYPALPAFAPAPARGVELVGFPSENLQVPAEASFTWPPVARLSRDEAIRAGLALSLLADGENAYLYRDLIDQKTRKFASGATRVGSWLSTDPAAYAYLSVGGLPAEAVKPETLERLADTLLERLRWLRGLAPGSPELAEVAERARARIRSARRSALDSMDGPPGFGSRGSGDGWHRDFDALAREPGFAKRLDAGQIYDRLLRELDAGANPWSVPLERLGVLSRPYVTSSRPDPELLRSQREAKAARLAGAMGGADLERFKAAYDSATVALEALDRGLPKPSFLKRPPLALDELDWSRGRLPSGPRIVRTRFASTPFTDLRVYFDLSGTADADLELLPLLAASLGEVGVIRTGGERLDYAQVEQRLEAEIYGLRVSADTSPKAKRYELEFSASASSPEEVDRAARWLGDFLQRPALGPQVRERLIDVTRARIQSARGLFQQDEEGWIAYAASAYRWQDEPLYMALESPFTRLRHLNRLRWRLEEPRPAELAVLRTTMAAVAAAAKDKTPEEAAALVAGISGELGEYFRWELEHLPEDSWNSDLARLASDVALDVGRSSETLARLHALGRDVLRRGSSRVHVNGSPQNVKRAEKALDAVLRSLPAGAAAKRSRSADALVTRRLRERFPGLARPVHVALVYNGTKTGSIAVSVPGPGYGSRTPGAVLDLLAYGVLSGGGAHSLFLKTWGAGLAYGNGLSVGPASERVQYYAERSPDLAQTLRFVADTAAKTALDDPFLLEYSLADAFDDHRMGGDFSVRGAAMAEDLEEGRSPETVRRFKRLVLEVGRSAGALARVRGRFEPALSRVLIGYGKGGVSKTPGASAFVVAPEELIAKYEAFLRAAGEAERVILLYPRDFWP